MSRPLPKPLPLPTVELVLALAKRLKIVGECWEWQGSRDAGYGTICLSQRIYYTHRIAYQLGTGLDPGPLLVCHHCDNPPCCRPSHLFLGTVKDNANDAVAKGRLRGHSAPGSCNHQAKLTEAQAIEIKYSTETGRAIAARFGISEMVVSLIKRGKRWTHI